MSTHSNEGDTSHVIPDWEQACKKAEARIEELEAQLGAFLDSTNRALEFALKRIENISAERIKEIEAHRATTLKLVALQQEKQR